MNYLNKSIKDLQQLAKDNRKKYLEADPFPSITFDNFFDEDILNKVVGEFPDLAKQKNIIKFDNHNEKKLAGDGESLLGENTKLLSHYLNSQPVLEFLQELTGIEETLIPDPYLFGGGYHEIKPGGLLKVHADFNKHIKTKLDRRINLLVYLNKDWEESYGGHFELWNRDMTKANTKILPVFNRIAIFSTTDFSYHGHPDPLTCPPDRSRRSLAFYYYSNGRPASELSTRENTTTFRSRAGNNGDTVKTKEPMSLLLKRVAENITPPILFKAAKRIIK